MVKKKIYSITSVRNEADIIESFVRYTMNFVDGMVISENCSSDNTLNILERLKSEGLNIDLIIDKNRKFSQAEKLWELTSYTMEKYRPDLILSLDADEFLFHKDSINPRKALLSLDTRKINKFQWVTFVVTGKEKKEEFIPKKFRYIREFDGIEYQKTLMSKEIYNKGGRFSIGSHDINLPDGVILDENTSKDLYLAHYPVRSKNQLMKKIIVGSLNTFSEHSRDSGISYHQIQIFDEILKTGMITDEILKKVSAEYAIPEGLPVIDIVHYPIKFDFCDNLGTRYPETINGNILGITLETAEYLISQLRTELESKTLEEKVISEKLKSTLQLLAQIYGSRGWKLIEFCRAILRKIFRRKV